MNADARPIDADMPWKSPNAVALDKQDDREQWIDGLETLSRLARPPWR